MKVEPLPPAPARAEILLLGVARFPDIERQLITPWLEDLIGELAPGFDSFAARLTGDRTMRAMNRDYRGRDETTDVLSFPGQPGGDGRHLGDVVISVAQAARQAETAGHPLEREIRLLLLHGVLHCLGHDHESDRGEMRRLERRLRRLWIDR